LLLIVISFIIFLFSANSIIGLVVGVILLDMGVQATHISNQSIIFALHADARNRINTIYMVTYFIGGALGAFVASLVWNTYQWQGVSELGIALSAIALAMHFFNRKKVQHTNNTVHS
jgi:predicted MFS family arabinose efflux permease